MKNFNFKTKDLTDTFGCPDCVTYRNNTTADGRRLSHWNQCTEHQKCIEYQHLSHQTDTKKYNFTIQQIDENELLTKDKERYNTPYDGFNTNIPEPSSKAVRQLTNASQTASILELLSKNSINTPPQSGVA